MAGYHSQTTVLFGHVCGFYYMAAPHRREYLPQVSLSVDAQLISSTSRTTLTQSFVNPKADPIPELRYSFPLYDGVSVVSFKCTINKDRVITGVVQEKAEARKTYNQAIERGETAALLEQLPEASDVFTTTVGNVPANASLDVEITYLGELKHDAEVDGIRFTIPTTIAPRYGDYPGQLLRSSVVNSGGINITIDAQMADGSNIKTIQSPTHPISVTVGNTSKGSAAGAEMSLQKASATLALGTTELDKDFVLHVVATNISNPVAVLETHPRIQNQRALMATLVPKFNLPSTRPEIVFVADRSGSMGMDNRIPDLKTAMQLFLKSLPVGVKFNICSFGSHHEFLFPDGSQSYDASTLEKATQYVKGFDSNFGGTDIYRPMEDVIEKRFKDMNLEIFLLTDGEIWDQEKLFSMLNEQIPQSDGAIRVFTLGIGRDVSHSLIEGVARAGNGFAQVVGDNEKMNSKVVRMLKASLTPHVSDYTLEVKYGKDADAPPPYNDDDDFEIVEKVMDGLTVDVSEPKQEKVATESSKPISLFDESADPDAEMVDATLDSSAGGKYSHVPPVSEPRILQAPFTIPPLFPFSRTTVYLLLSPDTVQKQPKSVVLRGMSPHGPLELEIPVTVLPEKGETIHQLAARKATRELEDGRGWIYHAKDETGKLLKKKYEGRFSDMVEREAVRLGVTYQIGGKWTSFVAVEANNDKGQSSQHVEPSTEEKFQAMQRVAPMPLFGGARLAPRAAQAVQVAQAAPFRSETLASLQTQPESLSDKSQKSVSKKKGRAFFGGTFASVSNAASGLFGSAPAPTFSSYAAPPPPPSMFMSAGAPAPASSLFGSAPTAVANHAAPAPGSSLFGSVSTAAASYAAPPYPPPMFVPAPVPEGSSPANLIGGPPPRASKKLGFGWMKPASVQSDRREQMDESMPLPDEDEEESQDAFASTGDKLDAIVALQTFEGKWVWSDRLLAILELKKDELKVKQSDEVATAIVLAYLEMKLADRKEEWEMLAEKAQEWLSGQGMNVGEEVAKVKGLF